jgi:cytochrome c556
VHNSPSAPTGRAVRLARERPIMANASSIAVAVLLVLPLAACGGGSEHHEPAPLSQVPGAASPATEAGQAARPANAVQHEMRLLLQALQATVAAIADNDLARIPSLITGIHGAREATEQAIESGSYRPPKNADKLEAFKAMDAAFHDVLVDLVKASQADDLEATTTAFGRVLAGCQGCHATFRFE